MDNDLLTHKIGSEKAPVIILFGGNAIRRSEIIQLLSELGDVSIHGTLSEAEGFSKITEMKNKVDLILIGGRYSIAQRSRIINWVVNHLPKTKISQPGFDYAYSNHAIFDDVKEKLNL